MEESKGRKPDLGPSETEERTNRRHERDPRSWGEKRENEDSGLRINEAGQVRESDADIAGNLQQKRLGGGEMQRRSNETGSSQYPVRPGVADCRHYAKNGLCSYGSKCHFNHPPHLSPARAIPDSQERDPREFFQYVTDDTAVDYKRVGIEHEGEILLGWQRMEAEDIVQEQRQAQEIVQEQRQAQFNVQREVEESVEERIMRENVEKERQIEIQRKKKEERLKLDQIEETAKSNIWNRMQIIGVRDPAGTESKEKKPARDIESERRESRLKLEQMKPTVQFNEGDRVRDVLTELGFERKEGDGF
ncbi:putative zinc finger CCCH domain-containing protein 9 [Eutrema salsugineum]|uniref:putative zinc finger CCCH domain-containing protein 9 n=1 Tax=Eutrema salsugineum TaxID=72664 RepID=UPI000CED47EC|nr:putative zinc finger CCCH domain-containing protein 9 [Eutrema salsugineum]